MSKAEKKDSKFIPLEENKPISMGFDTDVNTISLASIDYDGLTKSNHGFFMENGDGIEFMFYVDDQVDDLRDMRFTFPFERNDVGEDTITAILNVAAKATDGTEAMSWNVENGTAISLPASEQGKNQKYQYTLDNSNFSAGDSILINIIINEAGKELYLHGCMVRYFIKRV